MLEILIDRIQKLFAVKSIVTLALTGVFCVLCLNDMIGADQFMTVFTVVIAFYFGTQAEKKSTPTIVEALPMIEEAKADDTGQGGDLNA